MTVNFAGVTLRLLKVVPGNDFKNVTIDGSGYKQLPTDISTTKAHNKQYGIVKDMWKSLPNQKEQDEIYRWIHLHGPINKYCSLMYVDSFIY